MRPSWPPPHLGDRYISDRFLPDKAIDLIDEAGSRVRLLNSKLPPAAKEVDKQLRGVQKEKEDAVRQQDFTKAGELRDKEVELRDQIRSILQARRDDEPAAQAPDAEASVAVAPDDAGGTDEARSPWSPKRTSPRSSLPGPVCRCRSSPKASR